MKISSIFVAFLENTNFSKVLFMLLLSEVQLDFLKLVFSKKATKNDEIFTVDLTLTT